MRYSMPRRRRLGDPLASPKKIEQLLEELIRALGSQLSFYLDLESVKNGNFDPVVQLLQAASNFVRLRNDAPASTGKTARFPKSLLAGVVEVMTQILSRESQGRISFRTFTDNNLRILGCPEDIKHLLEQGRITLFEALQLKRLSAEVLALSLLQAKTVRNEFLTRCRREHWIAHRLRHEIDLKLGKRVTNIPDEPVITAITREDNSVSDDLPGQFSFAPLDAEDSLVTQHLSLMIELLQTLDTNELERGELERLLNSIDEVFLQLQRIRRRQNLDASTEKKPALGFA